MPTSPGSVLHAARLARRRDEERRARWFWRGCEDGLGSPSYELRGVRRASCSTRPGLFRLGELLDMGQHPMVNPVNEHVCPQRPIALRKDFVHVPSPAFEARSSIA